VLTTSQTWRVAELVWPLPAPDQLQVLEVRAPEVKALGCASGRGAGRCSLQVTLAGQSRELVYYENGAADSAVEHAVGSGEPVELLVLPPGTRQPLGAPNVWEVRQSGRLLLRYDQAVAETHHQQQGMAIIATVCTFLLTALVVQAREWLRRLNEVDGMGA